MDLWRRRLIFIVGVLEAFLFSGLIPGWATLIHVLRNEKIYGHLCEKPTVAYYSGVEQNATIPLQHYEKCPAQDQMFNLVYTLSSVVYGLTSIIIGFMLDTLGLWVTRIGGSLLLTAGFLFLGLTNEEQSHFIFPAMLLIGLGGNQLRISDLQFANLYPQRKSTVLTFYCGAYAASASSFLLFQFAQDAGISMAYVSYLFCGIAALTLPVTFFMPRDRIRCEDSETPEKSSDALKQQTVPFKTVTEKAAQEDVVPLMYSLNSLGSHLYLLWYLINMFGLVFFVSSFNSWVRIIAEDGNQVGVFNAIFGFAQLTTPFLAPLGGIIMDYKISKANKNPIATERRVLTLQAAFWPLFIATLTELAMFACKYFYTPVAVYVSLVSLTLARGFILANGTAYLRIRFPVDHFNRLCGIFGTVCSVVTLLQYPLYLWSENSMQDYILSHSLFLLLLLLSFTNPCHLLVRPLMLRQAKKDVASGWLDT